VTEQVGADRYAGRPLVRALDFYVLSIIGQIDEETSGLMDTWVRRAFSVPDQASWETALERQLELGASIRDSLRKMWDGYIDFEAKNGRTADPARFAMSVVDENFLPLISRLGAN
jgi:hypothetical protein